jgi:hypothetical protein
MFSEFIAHLAQPVTAITPLGVSHGNAEENATSQLIRSLIVLQDHGQHG